MEHHTQTIGACIGMIMSIFALPDSATIFTTIFLAAVGASTGFIVTFLLKLIRNWLNTKFNNTSKKMKDIRFFFTPSRQATIGGLILAIINAFTTLNWNSMDITKDWYKWLISIGIALGGYLSSVNPRKKPKGPIECSSTQL